MMYGHKSKTKKLHNYIENQYTQKQDLNQFTKFNNAVLMSPMYFSTIPNIDTNFKSLIKTFTILICSLFLFSTSRTSNMEQFCKPSFFYSTENQF